MFSTRLSRFGILFLVLLCISLSCATPEMAFLPGKGEDKVEQAEERKQPDEPEQVDATVQAEAPQAQGPFTEFSLDHCTCAGLGLPLVEERSSFSNNTFKMGMLSGGEVEATNRLTCDWEQPYKSDEKTGIVLVRIEMYRFDEPQYAQTAFKEYSNDVEDNPGWCEADETCAVTAVDFAEQRAFYAQETYYPRGEEILPSSHNANLVRLFDSGDGYFVMDMIVVHPELALGDAWVRDTAQTAEACMAGVVGK